MTDQELECISAHQQLHCEHRLAAERAAVNQEYRYLRALISDVSDALKILEESKTDPDTCDAAMSVAQRRVKAVFNRITDKIVEHETRVKGQI